ncbi:MAG: DNA-binding protein WhiA [Christensenellaceae bacterium]|jgi:DNA-binding protein WhiA|nr:DNA-binding protein WhiA [Christensenellaceae bacterium]
MSFSSTVKEELCKVAGKPCCELAELAALLHGGSSLQLAKGEKRLVFRAESAVVARRAFTLLKGVFSVKPQLYALQRRTSGRKGYRVAVLGEEAALVLEAAGLLKQKGGGFTLSRRVPLSLLRRDCCKRAYLRGAFLASGYLSDPERAYHLEFTPGDESYARSLCLFLIRRGIAAKEITRKEARLVYVKDSEQIVQLLSLMGAHAALLNMESVRVTKEVRNRVNRIVNCEQANIGKIMDAAQRQIAAIETIELHSGFQKLSPALRRMAEMRVEYPDLPLKELGELFSPPIGKSAVNHRLRKLEEIARDLSEEQGQE